MSSRFNLWLFSILSLTLTAAGPGPAQEAEGLLDFRADVARQIESLERRVGGDMPAGTQAVILQWLVQLYLTAGQVEDADRSYQRIIAFFPDDIGTLNAYSDFLIHHRHDYESARKHLGDAHEWEAHKDERSLHVGHTYEIWSELEWLDGNYERALRLAELAMEVLGKEGSPRALRAMGRSYRDLGRYDAAVGTYLDLIALESGVDLDDINELQVFVGNASKYTAATLRETIARAVGDARARRRAEIEAEGGTVIAIRAEDGVELEATLRSVIGTGAALLIADEGSRRDAYTPYAQLLMIDDISSLAVDLRGQGASRADTLLSFETLSPYHRDRRIADVVDAYDELRAASGFDDGHIAIIAEGNACATVEKALLRGRLACPVVYLSPVFDPRDADLRDALAFHPDREILVLVSNEDLAAVQSEQILRESRDRSHMETRYLADAGHGLEALKRDTAALEHVQEWARRHLSGN